MYITKDHVSMLDARDMSILLNVWTKEWLCRWIGVCESEFRGA